MGRLYIFLPSCHTVYPVWFLTVLVVHRPYISIDREQLYTIIIINMDSADNNEDIIYSGTIFFRIVLYRTRYLYPTLHNSMHPAYTYFDIIIVTNNRFVHHCNCYNIKRHNYHIYNNQQQQQQ